jgi:hypothetical protein
MAAKRFKALEVERINLVDKNGTLRLAIHNKDRIPDPVVDGETFKRQGNPSPGFIFFNDEGDECGGFLWSGRGTGDSHDAGHHISFDQYKQDQILTITNSEEKGQRATVLNIQDRAPGVSLSAIVRDFRALEGMDDGDEKTVRAAELQEKYWVHTRVVLGRDRTGAAVLSLNDSKGRPRIMLSVDSNDVPSFKFLDEDGKVTLSLPPD